MSKNANSKTYPLIDIMKFIFAILIVAIHIPPLKDFSYPANYMITQCLSRIGVPFFFMAAGFFLFRNMNEESLDIGRIKRYCLRIFMMLIAWTMLYLPLIIWRAIHNERDYMYVILVEIYNFILGGDVQFHLWFLHALIVAVVTVALLIKKKWQFSKMLILALVLHLVALLGGGYYFVYLWLCPEGSLINDFFMKNALFMPNAVNGLTMGFLYVLLGVQIAKKCSYPRWLICTGCVLSWLFLIVEVASIKMAFPFSIEGSPCVFLIPTAVFTFLLGESISLDNRPVYIIMRKMSMYVYFVHPWFIAIVALASKRVYHIDSLMQYILVVILSLIGARILVYFSDKYNNGFLRLLG